MREGRRVGLAHPGLRCPAYGCRIVAEIRRAAMPVQRRACHIDDAERLEQGGGAVMLVESEAAGDQYQAIDVNAALLQCVSDIRGAARTPALAGEEHGSTDGLVQNEPAPDEFRDGCDVTQGPIELALVG